MFSSLTQSMHLSDGLRPLEEEEEVLLLIREEEGLPLT